MRFWSDSFSHNGTMPDRFAFGKHDMQSHVTLADNYSPHFAWEDLPPGTKSLAIICIDTDCPTSGENVNKEGVTVPWSLPRTGFYHWTLVDIPADLQQVEEGAFSTGITPRGKQDVKAAFGTRQGLNNYTQWFESDPKMNGKYFGYDGPCPPWNDERIHHYHFTLYALPYARFETQGELTPDETAHTLEKDALLTATWTGTYSIYPKAH